MSYLAEIEAGKKAGSVRALCRIAGVLDVPTEHLVVQAAPVPGRSVSRVGGDIAAAA